MKEMRRKYLVAKKLKNIIKIIYDSTSYKLEGNSQINEKRAKAAQDRRKCR